MLPFAKITGWPACSHTCICLEEIALLAHGAARHTLNCTTHGWCWHERALAILAISCGMSRLLEPIGRFGLRRRRGKGG